MYDIMKIKKGESMEKSYETIESTSLKDDEKVDIYNLHIENQLHPALVEKWGTRLVNVKDAKRRLSRQLDLKYSEVELEIRSDPKSFGWEDDKKPTEAFIKSAVIAHEEYNKVYNDLLKADHDLDVFTIATNVISDKRASIEGEVKLFLNGYYADPKVPKEFKQEERKEQSDNQKRKLNERRK